MHCNRQEEGNEKERKEKARQSTSHQSIEEDCVGATILLLKTAKTAIAIAKHIGA